MGITANGNSGCRSTRTWPTFARDLRELADDAVLRFRDDVLLDSSAITCCAWGWVGDRRVALQPSLHASVGVGVAARRFSDYGRGARSLFRVHRVRAGIELGP